ncbi:hypothetical protein EZV62_018697 [Acer yangbiense]|uniref:Uncharacterized protein n=1 Tax=Acer yangbiense TaxID=1000413 RepID=A0A5C7HKF6_9ROSI|nr:hypothetical protein EZV62_018697 [Acer yangbiense]
MLFLIPSDERNKLQSKSLECIFLEFEKGVNGFKIYDMANKKKNLNRDVVFDEASMPNEEANDDCERGLVTKIPITTKISDSKIDEVRQEMVLEEHRFIAQERPRRVSKPPQMYGWDDENDERFDSYMLKIGYKRSEYDCCVYSHVFNNGTIILLMLYVDDMLIAFRDMSKIDELKGLLGGEFDMKDLGVAKKILRMEIKRDQKVEKLWLSQKRYIHKVLQKFSMLDAKAVSTPLASHFVLSAKQCPSTDAKMEEMVKVSYANVVGCFMYAMVCTRPDISQAVSVVAKYMANLGKEHWNAIEWILRYLKGTKELGIMFERQHGENNIVWFVDSDYAGDLDKRRSTMQYVFTCADGPISWRSILQPTSALSTTKAEYMEITEASKEAIWLKGLVNDMGLKQNLVL